MAFRVRRATAGSDGVLVSNLIREDGYKHFWREKMHSEFKNSVQIQGSVFVFRQVFSRLIRLVNGKSHKLGYYHEEKAKK